VVYDRLGPNGWFQIWTVHPDGSSPICISCGKPGFSAENNGNPAWYPSGSFIAYQATDMSLKTAVEIQIPSVAAQYKSSTDPGHGYHNNIWIMSADGTRTWQVSHVGSDGGTLHPHFSPAGDKLIWSEMSSSVPAPLGTWSIKIANVSIANGVPTVSNIQTLTPGGLTFYETHGFSPDGTTLVFTGSANSTLCVDDAIYLYNLHTQALRSIVGLSPAMWVEHAHFTPDGAHLIFMSSAGAPPQIGTQTGPGRTEFWMIKSSGSSPRQITHFNTAGYPEYTSGNVTASDLSVSPDGKSFVGFIQDNPTATHAGKIVHVTIPASWF
jgi:Tol biopolymer transport system component